MNNFFDKYEFCVFKGNFILISIAQLFLIFQNSIELQKKMVGPSQ